MSIFNRKSDELEQPAEDKPTKPGTFTKGYDPRRNYSGRPKEGNTLGAKVRDALKEAVGDGDEKYQVLDAIIDDIKRKALEGDLKAQQELMDRGWGKSLTQVDMNVGKLEDEEDELDNLTDSQLLLLRVLLWIGQGEPADSSEDDYEGIKQLLIETRLFDRIQEWLDGSLNRLYEKSRLIQEQQEQQAQLGSGVKVINGEVVD